MSELEAIKARAAERRNNPHNGGVVYGLSGVAEVPIKFLNDAEADLDRAIAIAGEQNKHLDAWEQWFHRIVDKFLAAGEQRKEARDDVLKLRLALVEGKAIGADMRDGGFTQLWILCAKALDGTEHYEAFR